MSDRHLKYWPAHAAHRLSAPATTLFYNAEVLGAALSEQALPRVLRHAGHAFRHFSTRRSALPAISSAECGVQRGDRVLLFMQNSPQFVIGYYGILRANAVVVPINPMSLTRELLRHAQDAGAGTRIVSQELYRRAEPLLGHGRPSNT